MLLFLLSTNGWFYSCYVEILTRPLARGQNTELYKARLQRFINKINLTNFHLRQSVGITQVRRAGLFTKPAFLCALICLTNSLIPNIHEAKQRENNLIRITKLC